MGALTDSYHDAGRRGEALEKRKELLALQQKLHGPEHPETLTAMAELALAYQSTGHRKEAFELGEKALEPFLKVLGPEHPDTLSVMHNLASSYKEVGRKDQALKLQEKVLRLRLKVNGATHRDTLGAIQNLVGSYFESAVDQAWQGKDAEHAETSRRLLELAAETADASIANRAAKAYCLRPSSDSQLIETALTLARRAVDLDKGHQNFPWDEMVLGMAEYRQGKYRAADQALAAAEELGKGNRFVRDPARFFHAMSLFQQGNKSEARQMFNEVETRMKPLPADEHQPLTDKVGPDNLVVWLAYKEAKAMLQQ
jgi:tetratricopeptide (TPR) repeat protein